MSAPTLAERARRIATLTALRRALDAELAQERDEHTAACLAAYEAEGTPRWDVRAEPGTPTAATFTIPVPKARTEVADPDALIAWARAQRPALVESVYVPAVAAHQCEALDGKAVTAYLSTLLAVGRDGMDPGTGEIVPGVQVTAVAPSTTTLRFAVGGAQALLSRWRDGLAPEMVSAVLPAIESAS